MVTRNDQLSLKSANKEARRQKVRNNKAKKNKTKGSKGNKGKKNRKARKVKRGKAAMKQIIPEVESTVSPSKRNIQLLRKRSQELADWWVESHPQSKKKSRKVESLPSGQSEPAASKVKTPKKSKNQGATDKQPAQAKRATKAKAKHQASKEKDSKVSDAALKQPKAKAKAKAKGKAKAKAAARTNRGEAAMDESLHCQEQIDTLIAFANEIGNNWDSVTSAAFKATVRQNVSDLNTTRLNIYWARTTAGVHVHELHKDMNHFSFNASSACAPFRVAVAAKCAELAAACLYNAFSSLCRRVDILAFSTVEIGGLRCFACMCRGAAIDFYFWMCFIL